MADCDLKAFLTRDPFPEYDLLLMRDFIGCLCSAVNYLHENKCRHKDIKPGNILIKGQSVLLTDFGLARDFSDRSGSTTVGRSGPYTPGYASPEVVASEPRNTPSDIWSLGCVYLDIAVIKLYACLKNALISCARLYLKARRYGRGLPSLRVLALVDPIRAKTNTLSRNG